jgi:SAM-dependent methyltransferase
MSDENGVTTVKPPLAERVRNELRRRRRSGRAVSGLRSQWSSYPRRWRRHRYLNMDFETLGEEWGGPEFADLLIDELIAERLGPEVDVLELGCGGGKFSQRIAPRVRSLVAADISTAMLSQAKGELERRGAADNVSFQQLNGVDFSGVADDSVDLIFSYDVQLHMQPQNVYSYLLDARRVLRPGGAIMVHQIALDTPGGMENFQRQFRSDTWDFAFDSPSRLGHIYFMSRSQIEALGDAAGLRLETIVDDFPAADSPLWPVTSGRDLIAFFRADPSRLIGLAAAGGRVLQADGDDRVWVELADKSRAAIISPLQFERAGFDWDSVVQLSEAELQAIPEAASPLESWE